MELPLDFDDYAWLQEEALKQTLESGRRVGMTVIVREALRRERRRIERERKAA